MKKFLAIVVCKIVRLIGKIVGKGSSLPGKYALKICPDILDRVKLPPYIIAVTGSNGKTSTVEMIARVLTQSGKKVAWNKEGSNQIEGVTTMVLSNATLGGRVKCDILLIESDERFAKYTFKYIHPTHYVITNLYRDQLTRNGHPEWVYDALAESIHDDMHLILNADDPLVSHFGFGRENVTYFGADALPTDTTENTGAYDDGAFCPHCKSRMQYTARHYNHIGHYQCPSCGYKRQPTEYTVTDVDLENGSMTINGTQRVSLAFKSLYHIYNILATYTVASIVGIEDDATASLLSDYITKTGRIVSFSIGSRKGTLLVSKHENSVSYDQSIRIAAADKNGCDVLLIVDAVSRKYFTSDVSWLWDIDFEALHNENVREIVLAGTYCNDLAVRFSYTNIPPEKLHIFSDIEDAYHYLDNGRSEHIYTITCFSDKAKFLSLV